MLETLRPKYERVLKALEEGKTKPGARALLDQFECPIAALYSARLKKAGVKVKDLKEEINNKLEG